MANEIRNHLAGDQSDPKSPEHAVYKAMLANGISGKIPQSMLEKVIHQKGSSRGKVEGSSR